MIDVEVLATGSKGNCYLLTSGEMRILLDCGIAYKKTLKLLDFKLPTAVLVTHEHQDHAKAAEDFIKHGVDVFMTTGTAMALGLEKSHRLNILKPNQKIYSIAIEWFSVTHDAAEPVNFIVNDGEDKILYITDTGEISNHFDGLTKILIETNYSELNLYRSEIELSQKKRIVENHLSVEKALKFLEETDLSALKEIFLIHISARHGDGEIFKEQVQKIVGNKIKVIVAKNKELA